MHELTPPSAAMAPVAVAARDLAAGATVSAGDLRVARLPADAVPQGASSEPSRTAPDTAAVPIRVADPASLQLLRPGQLVDVMLSADSGGTSGTGTTLAAQVPVLWAGGAGGAGAAGPWLGAQDAEGLLVVAARPDQALRVAGASARGKVFFTLVEAGPR